MAKSVYIAGVGLTKVDLTGRVFGSVFDLFAEAYRGALEDSRIRSFGAVQIGIMDSEVRGASPESGGFSEKDVDSVPRCNNFPLPHLVDGVHLTRGLTRSVSGPGRECSDPSWRAFG